MSLRTGAGQSVTVGRLLGKGGQAEVFEVTSPPGHVFKRMLPKALTDDPGLPHRLEVMVANRPTGWQEAKSGHVMLSWPTDVVWDAGCAVGSLMPLVDTSDAVELHDVANPSSRRDPAAGTPWTKGFNWRYLVGAAENLALALEILHESGVVVGDFNERNILVWSDARVTLVDCDSMQITDPLTGTRFLCLVGRSEWTAPELLFGANCKTTVRAPSSDVFALAIHLHQLLLEGGHPFDGVWHGNGDKPKRHVLARDGVWVHAGDSRLSPPPGSVGLDALPLSTANLFRRTFVDGATNARSRPTAREWHQELAVFRTGLLSCSADPDHFYAPGMTDCYWCNRTTGARVQNPLPRATASPVAAIGSAPVPAGIAAVAAASALSVSPLPHSPQAAHSHSPQAAHSHSPQAAHSHSPQAAHSHSPLPSLTAASASRSDPVMRVLASIFVVSVVVLLLMALNRNGSLDRGDTAIDVSATAETMVPSTARQTIKTVLSPVVTTFSPPPPVPQDLADRMLFSPTDALDWSTGRSSLNGRPYATSIRLYNYGQPAPQVYVSYVLGRNYGRLRAIVGIDDSASSSLRLRIEIASDGRVVFSKEFTKGQQEDIDLEVSNVYSIRFSSLKLNEDRNIASGYGVFADVIAIR